MTHPKDNVEFFDRGGLHYIKKMIRRISHYRFQNADVDDLAHDIALNFIRLKFIEKYDPTKGPWSGYFSRAIQNAVITRLKPLQTTVRYIPDDHLIVPCYDSAEYPDYTKPFKEFLTITCPHDNSLHYLADKCPGTIKELTKNFEYTVPVLHQKLRTLGLYFGQWWSQAELIPEDLRYLGVSKYCKGCDTIVPKNFLDKPSIRPAIRLKSRYKVSPESFSHVIENVWCPFCDSWSLNESAEGSGLRKYLGAAYPWKTRKEV